MIEKKDGHTVADFFCGAGGFSEGFRQMGFKIVFALDNWKPAIDTHGLNHPDCVHALQNILELDTPELIDEVVPDTEIIIGSPPCVAFSGSNKAGKADKTLGVQLIEAYLRIVAWKKNKPGSILRYWILENVPNSSSFIKDKYTFEELGLSGGKNVAVEMKSRAILNAANHGAPQTRTRFFGGEYPIPEQTHGEKEWVTIKDVMDYLTNPLEQPKMKYITDPIYGFKISAAELTDHFYDTRVEDFEWKNARRLKVDHGFMGKMSFPEAVDRPSRTIMATRSASTREAMILGGTLDKNGDWNDYRLPTIREIATFMSFPITYQFAGKGEGSKYRLVGNAVCAKLSRAIAEAILIEGGIAPPSEFIPLPQKRLEVDLTGTKRQIKNPSKRKDDAKFAIHVPGLKKKNMRVELTNKTSDFEKEDIQWACLLHWGSGKGATWYVVNQNKLEMMMEMRFGQFKEFKKDVQKTFNGRLPNPRSFQMLFCHGGEADLLSPMEALEETRELVDRHFPPEQYEDTIAGMVGSAIGVDKNDIPIRILAALYACNHVVEQVQSKTC